MSPNLLLKRLSAIENQLRSLYAARYPEGVGPTGVVLEGSPPPLDPDDGDATNASGEVDRLVHVVTEFGLSSLERDLLVAALMSEMSQVCGETYQRLSGMGSTRPTVWLLLELFGISSAEGAARGLLRRGAPLLDAGLLEYENPEAAYPHRCLRVPERVVDFLIQDDPPSQSDHIPLRAVRGLALDEEPEATEELLAELRDDPTGSVYLSDGTEGLALPAACAALNHLNRTPLLLDPDNLPMASESLPDRVIREARLLHGGIIVPVFTEPDSETAATLRPLLHSLARAPIPLVVYGATAWDPETWNMTPTAMLDLAGVASCPAASRSVDYARRQAALAEQPFPPTEAQRIIRTDAGHTLEKLARRIRPEVTRVDLEVPDAVRERLDMLIFRIRHRQEVLSSWRLRRGGGRGWGVAALFAGESGTGKTMAAEAIAHELETELFIISLPTLVSKYIGETEKNLESIFTAAESINGVLLFDEADSLFSKRSEVSDSKDKHANMQSSYLLQRLESFNGLAILTTNLRANMDSAFTRRFNEVIEFESPTAEVRARLWRTFLGEEVCENCDTDHLAAKFDLAGGSIRASVETAAFTAAAAKRPMSTHDLLRGIEVEYRKQGRLCDQFQATL
ncbi:ATP-binding protein [Streptomyces kronopolitis]|uniref:ATP-binding protein n=1 Tax=Streptomyces kronopolitis TaxID=1612435 RepID=UPI003696625D